VDVYFADGAFGVEWGATLQQVQAAHPGGTAWRQRDEEGIGEVVYAVTGDFRVLGTDAPVILVHFVFTKENKLQRMFFHFRYADREAALYAIAEILGQDYSTRDEDGARTFGWRRGRASLAKFEIGSSPQFPWAFLAVRTMNIAPGNGR